MTVTALPATDLSATEPDGAPRIVSLDVMRGIAILGILFMNINDMGASLWSSYGEVWRIGWTQADRTAWWLREVFADGTARGVLELLFGAGMVILTDRASARLGDFQVLWRYYVRNLVLLAFGLAHLFVLLWTGDILHTYALAAMVVVLFRRLPARLMLLFGLSLALFEIVNGGYGYYRVTAARNATVAVQARQRAGEPLTGVDRQTLIDATNRDRGYAKRQAKEARQTVAENAARTGSFATWARSLWDATLFIEGKGLELLYVWEAGATMLVGAALYRWGIIQGARSRRFYAGMGAIGYGIGLPLRMLAAAQTMRFDGSPNIADATYELARLLTTLGHVGAIQLSLGTVLGMRLLRPFAAAGATALSIYVLQSLIGLWLLYPPFALALYGKQGWAALMATALVMDAALLLLATWWVPRFAIAPVEWAWRSLAEGRRLPFGRKARPGASLPA